MCSAIMEDNNALVKYGMDMAVPMAIYTTIISLATLYADMVPPLSLLTMVMLLCGPLLLYKMQRKFYNEHSGEYGVSALWRMGVVIIFFGTIFTLLITYFLLEYVRPGFIYEQMQLLIDTYKQMPELKDGEVTKTLEYMVENELVPDAFSYALNMFIATNFSGMVMSAITASIATRPTTR